MTEHFSSKRYSLLTLLAGRDGAHGFRVARPMWGGRSDSGANGHLRLSSDLLRCLPWQDPVTRKAGYSMVIRSIVPERSSPAPTFGALFYVHKLLATYYLDEGIPSKGLHHFGELVGCSTDEVRMGVAIEQLNWGVYEVVGWHRSVAAGKYISCTEESV